MSKEVIENVDISGLPRISTKRSYHETTSFESSTKRRDNNCSLDPEFSSYTDLSPEKQRKIEKADNHLFIHNEDESMHLYPKTKFVGTSHHLAPTATSGINRKKYSNPFREYDLSAFPRDLLEQLEQFPVLQQIAILHDPNLQQRYFPQYCKS